MTSKRSKPPYFESYLNLVICIYPSRTAKDIFAATSEYEVLSEPEGRSILRGRDDMCHQIEICSIPAGGKRANQRNKDTEGRG